MSETNGSFVGNLRDRLSFKPPPSQAPQTRKNANWLRRFASRRMPILIVLVWAALYLPYLRTSPSWYGDETVALQAAKNLLHGSVNVGPLSLTFWQTYSPYQPGYLALTGLFSGLTGGDILGGRFFNALLALLTSSCIFFLGRRPLGILPALFGALLFLTYEQAIIHFRWIFTHNMVALGFTIMALYLVRPSRPKDDRRAGFGLAIAALAHPIFAYGAVAAFLSRISKPRAWLRMGLPTAVVLLVGFVSIVVHYGSTEWLRRDLSFMATAYAGDTSNNSGGGERLLANMSTFFSQDALHMGAAVCIALCLLSGLLLSRLCILGICGLVVSTLLLQNRQNLVTFYYQAIVLLPLLALAWAAAVSMLGRRLNRFLHNARAARAFQLTALLLPTFYFVTNVPKVWSEALVPRNQPWVTQSIPDVESIATWINAHTTPDDLVIANANLAWLLKARTADLLESTAWEGYPAIFLSDTFTHDRFKYSASIDDAKYVVIGDIDNAWTIQQPYVNQVLQAGLAKGWEPIWTTKTYKLFGRVK